MTDELPPELRELFDAERRRPAPDDASKARVRHALSISIGGGLGGDGGVGGPQGGPDGSGAAGPGSGGAPVDLAGASAAASAGGGAVKAAIAGGTMKAVGAGTTIKATTLALATAIAGAAGYGGVQAVRAVRAPDPVVTPAPAIERPAPPAFVPRDEPPAAPEPPEPAIAAPAVPARPPARRAPVRASEPSVAQPAPPIAAPAPASMPLPSAEERASRLRDERHVLEGARRALSGGDAAGALAAIADHEARFVDGALVEERDALRIQALVLSGRADEARAALARFSSAFPRSLFLRALEDAVR